jgi:DNA-binding NarL/FixJ family response regulator
MGSCGVILVVDDDECFRTLVVSVVEEAGYAAVAAATGEQGILAARQDPPDVAVVDIELPGISGYEVCRRLREESPGVGVVFVSGTQTERLDRVAGLIIGADDYLVKPFAPDELLARIRSLLQPRAAAPSAGGDSDLTRRERQVLALLGNGSAQAEIAETLVISPKTVAAHIERILRKLGVHSRAQAVAVAYRDGILDPTAGSRADS